MPYKRHPVRGRDEVRIEDIKINVKSWNAIPVLLRGLQYLYCDPTLRPRLCALLNKHIPPAAAGRPGTEKWKILVMTLLKQGQDCNFHQIHDLVNHHRTIRQFLGHGSVWDEESYPYRTVVDYAGLPGPEFVFEVSRMIKESGHPVARKKVWRALARRAGPQR